MNVQAIVILDASVDRVAHFAGIPLPLFDVLGRSMLLRTLDRLARYNILRRTIICARGLPLPPIPAEVTIQTCDPQRLWETAANFSAAISHSINGLVVGVGLGPYTEIDYQDLIRFHLQQHHPVTAAFDQNGQIPSVVFNAANQSDAAFIFRHQFQSVRHPYSIYECAGYSNPLREVADLRRLAIDSFCSNAEFAACANETKPGVWIAPTASVHGSARIVAPAFIGNHARIRAGAVITRCSAIEHHSDIGAGAILENATILPNTMVGSALDVAHSIVGFKKLSHLGRNLEIDIYDHNLVGHISTAPVRFLEQLASVAAYVPTQFLRGLFSANGNGKVAHLPSVQQSQYSTLAPIAEQEFPAHLAGVRRYGDD